MESLEMLMKLNKKIRWHEPKLLTEEINDEKKLNTSLAYRGDFKAVAPHELGTAEHRPHRGLIYDAPLGLKF
jgi:hypothetical protein